MALVDIDFKMANALRKAMYKALVCKNRDMLAGIEFAVEEIANALKLEGKNRASFYGISGVTAKNA